MNNSIIEIKTTRGLMEALESAAKIIGIDVEEFVLRAALLKSHAVLKSYLNKREDA